MIIEKQIEHALQEYAKLLLKWNKKINLISKNTEEDIWQRHILDSAQLYKYVKPEQNIFDLGSGAGLPGIVLSIMGVKDITLIESDTRKCAFLSQAALISKNKINIINERIEKSSVLINKQSDLIISRALNNIDDLLNYNKLFAPTHGFLLLKGSNFQKELDVADKNWHFDVNQYKSITNHTSAILEIKNVHPKN